MDQTLERQVLNHLIKDVTFAPIAFQAKITPVYFQWSTAGTLYRAVSWFVRGYGSLPNTDELLQVLQDNNIDDEMKKSVIGLFIELKLDTDDADPNALCDTFIRYHKQSLTTNAIQTSVKMLEDNKLDEATDALRSRLAEIEKRFRVEEIRSGQLNEFAQRIREQFLDRKINPAKYEGLKLGFPNLDKIMGGLVPPSVSILMAPPKGFKSALAMNICYSVAQRGIYCYYHANEGTIDLFYMRFAAMELGIPLTHIKDNTMDALEEARWMAWITSVEKGQHQVLKNIYFDEVPMSVSNPSFIAERIKTLRDQGKKVGFVVVDHFGRMTSNDQTQMQDWQRKGQIAQELCALALLERTPFLLLTHVKAKSAEEALDNDKNFDPYDLERSGQPLKDVDYVFSWRIENYETFEKIKKGAARLALIMSRHSETGEVNLNIDGKYMRISEILVGGTGQSGLLPNGLKP